jgi:hypothetical protein
MKNDIFNFRRFGKYFLTDIRGCWASYGLGILTICILPLVIMYALTGAGSMVFNLSWNGPELGARTMAAIVSLVCLVLTMPAKCYGRITEKRYGSFWLTLPASRLEKFLSMFLIACIIIPLIGVVITLGIDALICALDHSCGMTLISGIKEAGISMMSLNNGLEGLATDAESQAAVNELIKTIERMEKGLTSPWTIITGFLSMTLPFLCGAVWFKSGKTVKTILALMAFGAICSFIMTPFITGWVKEGMEITNDLEAMQWITEKGLFNKVILLNNISKSATNIAFMLGIWFRIKTLKH